MIHSADIRRLKDEAQVRFEVSKRDEIISKKDEEISKRDAQIQELKERIESLTIKVEMLQEFISDVDDKYNSKTNNNG